MGDRGNICLKGKSVGEVWLYTHWGGTILGDVLCRALARRQRWDDGPYLARIIYSEMLREGVDVRKRIDGDTGLGISSVPGDGLDHVFTLDVDTQTITHPYWAGRVSFEEYISGPKPERKSS